MKDSTVVILEHPSVYLARLAKERIEGCVLREDDRIALKGSTLYVITDSDATVNELREYDYK